MINPLEAGAATCASFVAPDVGARGEPAVPEVHITYTLFCARLAFWNGNCLSPGLVISS